MNWLRKIGTSLRRASRSDANTVLAVVIIAVLLWLLAFRSLQR
jgi:hypothetical protein